MKLNFSDLEEIRKAVRKILEKELLPYVDESEERGEFCLSAFQELAKREYAAPMLPPPYGMGSLKAQLVVAEEMGRISSGFGLSALASVGLFGFNVSRLGTEEQKKKYLAPIARGEKIGCWGLTEPDIGSDAVSIKTKIKRDGDSYVVHGTKTFITNAPIADYFIVIARESGESPSLEGGTAIILERGMPGLRTGRPFKKLGHLSSPTGEIFMDEVKIPASHILGTPGKAFFDMKASLDVERSIFSGLGIGMMDFLIQTMVRYGATRQQFGKPILEYQLYQEKIANAATHLEILRPSIHKLIEDLEAGKSVTKLAAMVKLFASKTIFQTASDAVQCLGGNGYMREYQVERFLRDAKLFEIGGGTSEVQKLIVAKQVIKEYL